MAPLADDCIHQFLPKSLGRAPRNNEEYRQYFTTVSPTFRDFHAWSDNEIYDVPARKAAVHMYSSATSPIGPYGNEYAIYITFNEDGTKVKVIEEMVDTAYSSRFFGELRAYVTAHGEEVEEVWGKAVVAAFTEIGGK